MTSNGTTPLDNFFGGDLTNTSTPSPSVPSIPDAPLHLADVTQVSALKDLEPEQQAFVMALVHTSGRMKEAYRLVHRNREKGWTKTEAEMGALALWANDQVQAAYQKLATTTFLSRTGPLFMRGLDALMHIIEDTKEVREGGSLIPKQVFEHSTQDRLDAVKTLHKAIGMKVDVEHRHGPTEDLKELYSAMNRGGDLVPLDAQFVQLEKNDDLVS